MYELDVNGLWLFAVSVIGGGWRMAAPLMWQAWKLTPPSSSSQPKAFLFVTISFRQRILSIRPFVGGSAQLDVNIVYIENLNS